MYVCRSHHTLPIIVELVAGDTSLEFLKAGEHIQVVHLSQLLLALGIVDLGFSLGIQDFGERAGVTMLGQHGQPGHITHHHITEMCLKLRDWYSRSFFQSISI